MLLCFVLLVVSPSLVWLWFGLCVAPNSLNDVWYVLFYYGWFWLCVNSVVLFSSLFKGWVWVWFAASLVVVSCGLLYFRCLVPASLDVVVYGCVLQVFYLGCLFSMLVGCCCLLGVVVGVSW